MITRGAIHHDQLVSFSLKEDHYGLLGIGVNASEDDIKNAFRKKALQFHPDVNNSVS
jgi:DnaJ-class molecular chaperone